MDTTILGAVEQIEAVFLTETLVQFGAFVVAVGVVATIIGLLLVRGRRH